MTAKNLVIVESPAKAKTIEKYLGKDFRVEASYGHIRDLPKSGMNIDIEGGTFAPTYEVSSDKKKRVSDLKKLIKTVDMVYLASDEDREGEAIAWHLQEALKLKPAATKRIVFHEITKPAILKAMENPRQVDTAMVDAQQARRVLDRLVGYELSPVLWKKVKPGLSAGRVQSVAVRMIVEREREILGHSATSRFRVTGQFVTPNGEEIKLVLSDYVPTYEAAQVFLESCKDYVFTVKDLTTRPGTRKPAAPFTTSTLQQDASRRLGFAVRRTMQVAQRLYEAGHITYMRTDSVNLSQTALGQAKGVISSEFGEEFHQFRTYKNKSKGAQEAHEAIRPTDLGKAVAGDNEEQKRLYGLIRARTLASQMAEAKTQKTTLNVTTPDANYTLQASGEVLAFKGFLAAYKGYEKLDDTLLPEIKKGNNLNTKSIQSTESFTRPPARFTEALLVKMMEEKGIGRPSTYAPTISTIQTRGYVSRDELEGTEREYRTLTLEGGKITPETETEMSGASRGRLWPTDTGTTVNDFLTKNFPRVLDYAFTAKVEEEFDIIAEGDSKWNAMIQDFYSPFKETVQAAELIDKTEAVAQRELGIHPKTGRPVFVRLGRYGPMAQMGTKDDEEKPKFASLQKGMRMETVTFEEILPLFDLPRLVGQTLEGEDIKANFGRFGPYVQVGKLYASIKDESPLTISLELARELIVEKKKTEAEKYIHVWEDEEISVLNGRWGPYIKHKKENIKLPKDIEPKDLTLEDVKKIIKNPPPKRRAPRKKKK